MSTPSQSSRPCRNIAIYGFCKFAGTTCRFNHDVPSAGPTPPRPGHLADRGQYWSPGTQLPVAGGARGATVAGGARGATAAAPAPSGLAASARPFLAAAGSARPFVPGTSYTPSGAAPAASLAAAAHTSAAPAPAPSGLSHSAGRALPSAAAPAFVPSFARNTGMAASAPPFRPASAPPTEEHSFMRAAGPVGTASMAADAAAAATATTPAAPAAYPSPAPATATAHVAGGAGLAGAGAAAGVEAGADAGEDAMVAEEQVPVVRGGMVFFVPASQAAVTGGAEDRSGTVHTLLLEPVVRAAANRRTWRSLFMPDRLYEYYQRQSAWLLAQVEANDPRYKEIPPKYTRVFPLDHKGVKGTTGSYGYVTSLFKVTSTETGLTYALRRVDNVRASLPVVRQVLGLWKRVDHPGVIKLRESFVHHGALFFAHDFYPGAKSMREYYLDTPGTPLPEQTLWSFVCQLTTALQAIHSAGLSCRGVHATRVLVTGHNRVRFEGSGVLDVLEVESKKPLPELQREDLLGLGNLLMCLACRNPRAMSTGNKSMEFIGVTYSAEFRNLVLLLVTKPVTAYEVLSMIGPQLAQELGATVNHADAIEAVLARECENGRLLRILIKLGLINERPEHRGDEAWSETGDRYLLKLFRNYVFHQIDATGMPVFDMGHIMESLNKLDVGDDEKVLLSSPDEQTLLVASYDDVRMCLNSAYDELRATKTPPVRPALASVTGPRMAGVGMAGVGGGMGRGRGRGAGRGGHRSQLFTPATAAAMGRGRGGAPGGYGAPMGHEDPGMMYAAAAARGGGGYGMYGQPAALGGYGGHPGAAGPYGGGGGGVPMGMYGQGGRGMRR